MNGKLLCKLKADERDDNTTLSDDCRIKEPKMSNPFDKIMPPYYVGLCTADPTIAGTGARCNEIENANGYARVSTVRDDWRGAMPGGIIGNAVDIFFPQATRPWGKITHFALFDSGVRGTGNMIASGELLVATTISSGDTVVFGPDNIGFSL